MLVMSLSPLLGQAIPDIAETTKIVVFPRRGARSGCSRVLKPHGLKSPRDPPRTSWRLLGGAVGLPWERSCSAFVHCVAFCSCLRSNPQFFRQLLLFCSPCKRFKCNCHVFSSNLAEIRLKSRDFADRVAAKTENRKSAGYAVPAILS